VLNGQGVQVSERYVQQIFDEWTAAARQQANGRRRRRWAAADGGAAPPRHPSGR
jgi:hypothetical protein